MDQNERRDDGKLTIDKDAQINVIVNRPETEEMTINLGRVFHNMKLKSHIFAWVLVLCLMAGVCAPLLMYQFNKPMLTVASVVTLRYDIVYAQTADGKLIPLSEYEGDNPELVYVPVADLTAPDGKELDLSLITSAYVLQQAMSGMDLSQPITLGMLRNNISVERVLTDESRQAQELASKMSDDKSSGVYDQMQNVSMKYDCKFVVRLTNGFRPENDPESRIVYELTDDEIQTLLDRVLSAYNNYLVMTYANMKLPDDEISVIDTENLDILESLELLRTASDDLYEYCDTKSDSVKAYRSYRDGRSLNDWMQTIRTGREVSIDYLYSDVYTNTIVRDRETMITSYQYQLRNAQTKLDTVNENIATTKTILESYKNDEIFVSMQESDASKATSTTTDYYNELILQQSKNYAQLAALETQIADLKDKIANLSADTSASAASEQAVSDAEAELEKTIEACRTVYEGVRTHMEELMSSAFYTDYAEHTVPQGKVQNFLSASLKKMIIGGVVGAILACGLWFLAALAPEFQRGRKEENGGKEAAEA